MITSIDAGLPQADDTFMTVGAYESEDDYYSGTGPTRDFENTPNGVRAALEWAEKRITMARWPLDCIGMHVRLKHRVDRTPHFIAPKGATGTVVQWDPYELSSMIAVRLDEPVEDASEWQNQVHWYGGPKSSDPSCLEEFAADIVVIATTNPCRV